MCGEKIAPSHTRSKKATNWRLSEGLSAISASASAVSASIMSTPDYIRKTDRDKLEAWKNKTYTADDEDIIATNSAKPSMSTPAARRRSLNDFQGFQASIAAANLRPVDKKYTKDNSGNRWGAGNFFVGEMSTKPLFTLKPGTSAMTRPVYLGNAWNSK